MKFDDTANRATGQQRIVALISLTERKKTAPFQGRG